MTEGRDQGTLVFPDAFRKFYLTATDVERARRRVNDYRSRGADVSFESVLRDQRERDARDAARTIAPMKAAPDAIVIDTSGLSVEEVVDLMVREVEENRQAALPNRKFAGELHDRAKLGGCHATERALRTGVPAGAETGTAVSPAAATDQPAVGSQEKLLTRPLRERSIPATIWYHSVRYVLAILALVVSAGERPVSAMSRFGGRLLVCNHVSFFDVVFLGVPLGRPLNYMARSTLFVSDTGLVYPISGGVSDSARGNGGVGHERDAPSAARRRNRDPFSRGHP